jgi:hypothetical protein
MANHAAAVTPSDTVMLPSGSAWLSFANSGAQTLIIDTVGGEVGVSILLPSGMWPIRALKVRATGTTVTSIVTYWD